MRMIFICLILLGSCIGNNVAFAGDPSLDYQFVKLDGYRFWRSCVDDFTMPLNLEYLDKSATFSMSGQAKSSMDICEHYVRLHETARVRKSLTHIEIYPKESFLDISFTATTPGVVRLHHALATKELREIGVSCWWGGEDPDDDPRSIQNRKINVSAKPQTLRQFFNRICSEHSDICWCVRVVVAEKYRQPQLSLSFQLARKAREK